APRSPPRWPSTPARGSPAWARRAAPWPIRRPSRRSCALRRSRSSTRRARCWRGPGSESRARRGPAPHLHCGPLQRRLHSHHRTDSETPMDRRSLLKTGLAGSAAIAAPLVLTSRASAQSKYRSEYRMSTVVGTAFPWGKGGDIWLNLVRERTQGRINIKLYPGVSLINGDQTREFSAIRQGVIDLAVGSTINWSPQIRQLNLFSLPFLTQDHAGIDALTK